MVMATIFPLVLENIGFSPNGTPVLRDVSLTVELGGRTLILGANGAGKSVLMRLMHGLLQPTAGRIAWAGGLPTAQAQALVFQRPVMLRRSTLANVAYGLKLAGVPHAERQRRAETARLFLCYARIKKWLELPWLRPLLMKETTYQSSLKKSFLCQLL